MVKVIAAACLCFAVSATCPPKDFSSIKNFDLNAFIASRWYIHQMMETSYLPKTQNWCVFAEYVLLPKKSFLGYDVHVHNHAEEQNGTVHDSDRGIAGRKGTYGGIMAKIVNKEEGQLEVAPWFLPTFLSGPYWVIDFSDSEGWGLISGGAPKETGKDGLCKTGSGTNDSGLWIFTRKQQRDDKLITKIRGIAKAKGFDLSVLNDVDHSHCGATDEISASDVLV